MISERKRRSTVAGAGTPSPLGARSPFSGGDTPPPSRQRSSFSERGRRFTGDGHSMINTLFRRLSDASHRMARRGSSSNNLGEQGGGRGRAAKRLSLFDSCPVTNSRACPTPNFPSDFGGNDSSSLSSSSTFASSGGLVANIPAMSRRRPPGRDTYRFGPVLGVGTFSVVKLVTEEDTGRDWACKVIPLARDQPPPAPPAAIGKPNSARTASGGEATTSGSTGGLSDQHSTRDEIFAEVELLRQLRHPNILHLRDVFEEEGRVYLVTELLTGGELLRALMERGSYAEEDAREIFRQLLLALKYMHAKGIVHRDIKLENLILTTHEDITRVKLVDFGLATYLSHNLTTVCGTPQYVAPEVLRSVSGEPYGAECDLWSAGVLLFNLLAGYPPFHSDSVHKVLQQVAHGNIDFRDPVWELISPAAIDLVCGLLTVDRTKRLSVEQALKHPWMVGR